MIYQGHSTTYLRKLSRNKGIKGVTNMKYDELVRTLTKYDTDNILPRSEEVELIKTPDTHTKPVLSIENFENMTLEERLENACMLIMRGFCGKDYIHKPVLGV
jgi:hypothetical protein